MTLVASGSVDARRLVEPLRDTLQRAEPTVLFSEIGTLAEATGFAFLVLRATGTTVGVLGAIGFAIALIGVYGVVAYTVQQRSRELAIRKALGATTASVYRLVLWSGFRMLALGALLGVLIAAGVTGVLRSTIYALSTFDPVTFIGVPTALVAIGLLASWLAARRGVGVDPNQALKNL